MDADMTLKTQNTHHTVCPDVFVVLGGFFFIWQWTRNTQHTLNLQAQRNRCRQCEFAHWFKISFHPNPPLEAASSPRLVHSFEECFHGVRERSPSCGPAARWRAGSELVAFCWRWISSENFVPGSFSCIFSREIWPFKPLTKICEDLPQPLLGFEPKWLLIIGALGGGLLEASLLSAAVRVYSFQALVLSLRKHNPKTWIWALETILNVWILPSL